MRTLLTVCTLMKALLVAPPAGATALGERADQSDAGFVDVSSDPPAHLFIDDVDTKKLTPQDHLELKAGHHKLTLITLDGACRRTLGFKVEIGQTTKLTIHLAR